jgi:hypothetical protein
MPWWLTEAFCTPSQMPLKRINLWCSPEAYANDKICSELDRFTGLWQHRGFGA